MAGLNLDFDSIERFLFELFVVASLSMTVIRMLLMEWRSLKRLFFGKRRRV
jgi:hypothetical protein